MFAVEIDEDDVFGARRQLGGDLGLGAAQHEVADAAAETSSGGRVFGGILAAETGLGAEEAGLRKGEEAPEIKETIFDRRAGERDAVRGGDGARDGGGLARRVFDELSFVENDRIPVVAVKPRGVQAELSVVDDEQGAAIRGAGHFGAVGNERREDFSGEFGRETFGLGEPAVHDALGADDEGAKRFFIGAARLSGGVGVGLVQEPGEGLHGFTETHVVGQNTAEAAGREVREKLKPFFLIRAQGGAQAGGKRRGGNRGEGGGALAERVGEGGVFGGEGIDLGDELERVQPVFRGLAGGEHVFGAEAETVEGGFGAVVGGRSELEAPPTVVGQADPFAARLEEQGEFVGLERGVFDAEFDGEVEPVAAFAGGGRGGKFHVTLQGRAEEAGQHRRGFDFEIGRQRFAPGEKFFGERLGHGPSPDVDPTVPIETKFSEATRDSVGAVEIELEQWLVGRTGRGGFAGRPLPAAFAVPLLFAGGIAGTRKKLGVKIFGGVGLGVRGAPALDDRPERDAADAIFQGRGQAQARGTEARHEASVGQDGGGDVTRGERRRAAPDAAGKQIERLGFFGDEPRFLGVAAVGREEAKFEAIALRGRDDGFGNERLGLDDERLFIRADNRIAGGRGGEKSSGAVGGKSEARRVLPGVAAAFSDQQRRERGFGGRAIGEIGGARSGERGEPALRGRAPGFVGGGADLDQEFPERVDARAEADDIGRGIIGVAGAGGFGSGKRGAPDGEFLLDELIIDGGMDGRGVGERPEKFRNVAARLFVMVSDILPERPRIARRGFGIPPIFKNRRVQLVAGSRDVFEAVGAQLAGVELAGAAREIGEEGGDVAELAAFAFGESAAEFLGEDRRPLHAKRVAVEGGRGRG